MGTEKDFVDIVGDLREIVLNNTDFPDGKSLGDKLKLREAITRFRLRNNPRRNREITIKTAKGFIEKHRVFGLMEDYFRVIGGAGAKLITLEGPDAAGKTALSEKIGEMTNGASIEHQSAALFRMMFGLPKIYKTAIVDYNKNAYVGFLFYVVDNLLGLRQAARHAKAGTGTIILDSSFFRTFASRMANPTTGGKLKLDQGLYHLIEMDYGKRYVDILEDADGSLLIVFMYISEKARLEQVKARGNADDYDTSSAYSKLVTGFIREEERMVKKRNINSISLMMLAEGEQHTVGSGSADFYVVRTGDLESDLRKKAEPIIDNV
jgi:thymidylate kinase